MIQTAILILSGLAFWLTTAPAPTGWGFALGVMAQPLWIYETWRTRQWGMCALSLCFLAGYLRGVWHHWM